FLSDLADDGVGDAIQHDLGINGIAVREKLLRRLKTDHGDTPRLVIIGVVDQPPAFHLNGADTLKDRPHTAQLKRCRVEWAFHTNPVAHDLRRDKFNLCRLLPQSPRIANVEPDQPPGALAARLFAGAAVADDDDVLAKLAEDGVIAALETLADGRENHDR